LSSTHELDIVRVNCDGQCCEALFQQFDDDLLLHLVNVCYLCPESSEGSTYNLYQVSNTKLLDYRLRDYESFDRLDRNYSLGPGAGVSCSGYRLIYKVGSVGFDENVSLDDFRREDRCYGQFLDLGPARHEVDDGPLLTARCADCVDRGLLGLLCHASSPSHLRGRSTLSAGRCIEPHQPASSPDYKAQSAHHSHDRQAPL